jgi:hypothetical protein
LRQSERVDIDVDSFATNAYQVWTGTSAVIGMKDTPPHRYQGFHFVQVPSSNHDGYRIEHLVVCGDLGWQARQAIPFALDLKAL